MQPQIDVKLKQIIFKKPRLFLEVFANKQTKYIEVMPKLATER